MEPSLLALAAGAVVIAVIVAVVVRSRASARRARVAGEQAERDRAVTAETGERERAAGSALVRTDERIRLADDELGFAIADFGDAAGADLAPALDRARQRLAEAFHLNQLLNDHVRDAPEQRREWADRIVSLCQSADAALAEQHAALTARRAAVRRAPSEIERVRASIARLRSSVPEARTTVARLSERYSATALEPIADNTHQAEQLLSFAERSCEVAESRMASARDGEADAATRAGAETVQRAEGLLSAVSGFEVQALQAESTLAAMVAESRAELAAATALPESDRRGRIDAAIAALRAAVDDLPAAGASLDPIGSLAAVRRANSALDDAVAERAQTAERKERLRAQLVTAIDDAERQIAAARELVTDYRAPIGPDARTRLAEAEREIAEMTDEREPDAAIARARRASALASDAAAYARADLAAAQRPPGWDPRVGGSYGGRGGGGSVLGGVLGGLAIGGLLDGIGDLGDLGDFLD